MDDLLHTLLGCEWGHGPVAAVDDREPCSEQADGC